MQIYNGSTLIKLLAGLALFFVTGFFPAMSMAEDYTLDQGLNLLGYPFEVPAGYSAFDFLSGLGESYVGRIERYNTQRGAFEAASWLNNQTAGVDFPIVTGEGCFVRMAQGTLISGTSACDSVSLKKGFNLTGVPCPFSGYTSFDLLQNLGDDSEVESIEKYDGGQNKYLKTYYDGGSPAGSDFNIVHGEAYIISMLTDRVFTAPPTGLSAIGRDRLVLLTWNPPLTDSVTGYNIYRTEDPTAPNSFTKISTALITTGTYTDASVELENGKTYYYAVSAVYPAYESVKSVPASVVPTAGASTSVTADITGAVSWTPAGSPYVLQKDIKVLSGSSLSIDAGTVVRSVDGGQLEVEGTLTAAGGHGNQVVFTSDRPDSGLGAWEGIVFRPTSTGSGLDSCVITHAQSGISCDQASPSITNCLIQRNIYGLNIGINSSPTISENTIVENASCGINIYGDRVEANNPNPVITGNDLISNGYYNLRADGFGNPAAYPVNTTGNWWGTDDTDQIGLGIFDESDFSPTIDFSGYASSSLNYLALYNFYVSLEKFSPYGQTLGISFETTKIIAYSQITIKNDSGQVVMTFLNWVPTQQVSRSWDGTDLQGAVVPDGIYTIQASVTDVGEVTTSQVKTVKIASRVLLTANIESGTIPLEVYFNVETYTAGPVTLYEMDYDGDSVIDDSWTTLPSSVIHTYNTEGTYNATITITDDQSNTYSDSVAIEVLSEAQIDALLKGVWNGMKGALTAQDVLGVLDFFHEDSKGKYIQILATLINQVPNIASNMPEIQLDYVKDDVAEYRITRMEDTGGQIEEISYFIYFIKDRDGFWKVVSY